MRFSLTLKAGPKTVFHVVGPDINPRLSELEDFLVEEKRIERLFGLRAHISDHPHERCPECSAVDPIRVLPKED